MTSHYANASPVLRELPPPTPHRRPPGVQPPSLRTTALDNASRTMSAFYEAETPASAASTHNPFSAITPGGSARESPMSARESSGFGGAYNPQQWGPMSAGSGAPHSAGGRGQIRSTHLAPRLVGPDEPVGSPPPPYSPRRESAGEPSAPPSAARVTSPATTLSPNTDASHGGTPISAATTISPDFAPRPYSGRSPVVGPDLSPREIHTARTFPPPPPGSSASTSTRIRSASRAHADRLLSSVTSRTRAPSTPSSGNAIDTLQQSTFQALARAPTMHPDPTPIAPASRRAASTGGIGLASAPPRTPNAPVQQPTWEAGTPLPPPPPGPPPRSVRSQSLNRASPSESSSAHPNFLTAPRTREAHSRGTALGPVPPTPADWRDESPAPRREPSVERPQLLQPLHIDTGSAVQRAAMGSDDHFVATPSSVERHSATQRPRRDSSTSALFRSPAVRNRSAKGIRARRSESRHGRDSVVDSSSAMRHERMFASPADAGVSSPSDLIMSKEGNLLSRRLLSQASPRTADAGHASTGPLSPRSPFGAVQGRFVSLDSARQPDSARSHLSTDASTPTPPFSPGNSQFAVTPSHSGPQPGVSPKALPTPPLQSNTQPSRNSLLAPRSASQERPVSHLLHLPHASVALQQPLVPLASPPEELIVDLLGPENSDTFSKGSIERHRDFAQREAGASTDAERLDLFVQYMTQESKIRRQQYAAVFHERNLRGDELTRGLFQSSGSSPQSGIAGDPEDDDDLDSMYGSEVSDSSSDDLLCRTTSSATGKQQESPITNSTASSHQYRPDSSHWGKEYQPCLSPIASMSIVTGQDEENSRGRAPSRWWEDASEGASRDEGFNVLGRSKRESKYMGLPKEARNSPAFFDNVPASVSSSHHPPAEDTPRASYAANEYSPEKPATNKGSASRPPPPAHPPTPSSAPFTPSARKLDISRLVTLPPPYPRHHPAVNNNHPDLADERATVRSLHDTVEVSEIKSTFENSVATRRQRAESWSRHQRSLHAQEMQFRIDHGEMSETDFDRAETELEGKLARSEKEAIQTDFDTFQTQVVTPLHGIFSARIATATSALEKLSSHLFDTAQSHSPNMPQEEGDDSAELLEKLTMLKWLFEARETLHRDTYNLLSERNDKYRAIVMLPYKLTKNTQKQAEAEQFFLRDARERQIAHDQAASSRLEAFLKVVEGNVTRGVEIQLSAFWDIAPNLLSLIHKVPTSRSSSPRQRTDLFSVSVPAEEYDDNPSYHAHPLQYLYSLLAHAEKSTYQFIESQTNLFCLLHEIRFAAMNARIRAEISPPDHNAADADAWDRESRQRREVEERQLTEDLKEKVGVVEGQWDEALGREMKQVRERVREWLLEEGGWDEELEGGV